MPDENGSTDVVFWRSVFRNFRPDMSITVKAIGGKPELELVAHKVSSGLVDNTLVAMDADFDELLGEKIKSKRVLYTHGYSWENDAFNFSSLKIAIERLTHMDAIPDAIISTLYDKYKSFMTRILRFVNIDFRLRRHNSSFFPNISSGCYISHDQNTSEPLLDYKVLRQKYSEIMKSIRARSRDLRINYCVIIDASSYLQGHVARFFARKIANFAIRLFGKRINVNDDLLFQAIIPSFCDFMNLENSAIRDHYNKSIISIV